MICARVTGGTSQPFAMAFRIKRMSLRESRSVHTMRAAPNPWGFGLFLLGKCTTSADRPVSLTRSERFFSG